MALFNQYYDLKNESQLPPGAVFIDPTDNATYTVKSHESLDDFTKRIESSREQRGNVSLFPHQLKLLIKISLAESVPQAIRNIFFTLKAAVPSTSELIKLAKTVSAQYRSGRALSYNHRQERAAKCNACVFHRKSAEVNEKLLDGIEKVAGLEHINESPTEQALGMCGMCGCGLRSKIKFSLMSTLATIGPEELSRILSSYKYKAYDKCWILNEAVEDSHAKKLLVGKLRALDSENGSTMASSTLTAYTLDKEQSEKNAT